MLHKDSVFLQIMKIDYLISVLPDPERLSSVHIEVLLTYQSILIITNELS